jgi:hypothetical protein
MQPDPLFVSWLSLQSICAPVLASNCTAHEPGRLVVAEVSGAWSIGSYGLLTMQLYANITMTRQRFG